MAGHSHFKNIMRRKGAQDAKKAKILTKITREILVAAKGGPDPNFNAKLRAVMVKARQAGMPKDKIDAAIAKGSGTGSSENYDAVRYEGYGPGGIAVIVEALTDNRNRTAADVRSIFTKNAGNMGETGSVGFMFDYLGFIEYPAERIVEEAMLEAAIEAGAENCETADGVHTITTTLESFIGVRDGLAKKFGDATASRLTWVAKTPMAIADDQAESLMGLMEALEDHDDVQDVFTNAEFSSAALEKLSA